MKPLPALLILLAGCTAHPAPRVANPPPALIVCEAARPLPVPPPAPRTAGQLFDWAKQLQAVATLNAAALGVCQGRIERLNAWWLGRTP